MRGVPGGSVAASSDWGWDGSGRGSHPDVVFSTDYFFKIGVSLSEPHLVESTAALSIYLYGTYGNKHTVNVS